MSNPTINDNSIITGGFHPYTNIYCLSLPDNRKLDKIFNDGYGYIIRHSDISNYNYLIFLTRKGLNTNINCTIIDYINQN